MLLLVGWGLLGLFLCTASLTRLSAFCALTEKELDSCLEGREQSERQKLFPLSYSSFFENPYWSIVTLVLIIAIVIVYSYYIIKYTTIV